MRAATININVVCCPFCRSLEQKSSALIVCSDCKSFHHRECWTLNQGCSVFGCTGIMQDLSERRGEPKSLIALRILVFGFIPTCVTCLLLTKSVFVELFLGTWGMAFIPGSLLLLLLEIIYLHRVCKHPELRSNYGHPLYHIISITAYSLVFLCFVAALCIVPLLLFVA